MDVKALDDDTVRTLARVAGIELPDEDVIPLAAALKQHLASIAALPTPYAHRSLVCAGLPSTP